MRIRIRTCDPPESRFKGFGPFVRVENAETGELIDGVVSVSWKLNSVSNFGIVTLEIMGAEVDVEVENPSVLEKKNTEPERVGLGVKERYR